MKKTPLHIYLADHLAGATFALDLIGKLRDRHRGEPLGRFVEDLLAEIEEDRVLLRGIAHALETESNWIKEGMARFFARLSRVKLRRHARGGAGTLESLETLYLGIRGKEALWHALAVVEDEPRLQGIDYLALAERARRQAERVNVQRLSAARRLAAT